ncbi:calpain-like cysteine peptidase, putative [Trypanosoma equiperdum]|uniref:Calpain-like cysteine peptidase, putative n=2 Tax=Trypanozoon TaxID=39700 RepID=Q38EJ3_TRYB2|nr:calpain-like cysteine peptidase, putative [Trypanosoma brucei brucei TREU927]EAN76777.1 calpain-like cysteine peptidase, putative [Trypanosoma brucei brucei TREU927]SCU70471.1 calpain-like cysteine peptidase, putative [Trypanosoma equiperdum]
MMQASADGEDISPENGRCSAADISDPPTELLSAAKESAFSDSSDADSTMEKKPTDDTSHNDGCANGVEQDLLHQSLGTGAGAQTSMSYRDYVVKRKKIPQQQPVGWEPFALPPLYGDEEDEFDVATLRDPVFSSVAEESPEVEFVNGTPTLKGEIISCFQEPGILYRIVDRQEKIWAFYNDTLDFEVLVSCSFSKYSNMEALGKTKLRTDEDGVTVAEVVVYPTETELFVKGLINGFNSKFSAIPLSDTYLCERRDTNYRNVIEVELMGVKEHVGNQCDAAKVLATCVKYNTPFVDLEFLPQQSSISNNNHKDLRPLPWSRPRMYVNPWMVDQIRLFRNPIIPGDVRHGELGDCWLMCAIATMAEMPEELVRMFRHPFSAARARDERAVGGYRLTVNKNGLWNSVIVDDYLPSVAGVPRFGRSTDPCELWPAILEKAYAKLHGCYAKIRSGDPVHALTDMSGCPTMRLDEEFATTFRDGGKKLFELLQRCHKSGYQIILTTAGGSRAVVTDKNEATTPQSNRTDAKSLMDETGLVPGYAYTVRAVHGFTQALDLQLVRVRNVWGKCANWKGPWSVGSSEWSKYPDIAEACNYQQHEETDVWMDWRTALKYFNGGGVHFYEAGYDYRVPLVFNDCRPSLALEVSVVKPMRVCFILSTVDYRVLSDDANTGADQYNYPPMMISLSSAAGQEDGRHRVILNTTMNAAEPSAEEWTFVRAREIGMFCHLTPEQSPYLVIPRMAELEDTMSGSKAWFTHLRDKVNPSHFANVVKKKKANKTGGEGGVAEIPVVLGVRCSEPLAYEDGCGAGVDFKYISGDNVVFENFPRFPNNSIPVEEVLHQKWVPVQGLVEELVGSSFS